MLTLQILIQFWNVVEKYNGCAWRRDLLCSVLLLHLICTVTLESNFFILRTCNQLVAALCIIFCIAVLCIICKNVHVK